MIVPGGIAIFCEDIRLEEGGSQTIIGAIAGNLEVPSFPATLPKLGIYIRVNIPAAMKVCSDLQVVFSTADGSTTIATFTTELIENTRNEARTNKLEFVGLVASAISSPFVVPKATMLAVDLRHGDDSYRLGQMGISAEPGENVAEQDA